MMRWLLVSMLAFLPIIASRPLFGSKVSNADMLRMEGVADEALQKRILDSTIQMFVITSGQNRNEGDPNQVTGKRGLGTLVKHGTGRLILTHDHWEFSKRNLIGVELRNHRGERLLLIDGATFHSLIRYRDGGTMLLQAPEALMGVVPATLANSGDVAGGDRAWLAAYDPHSPKSTRIVSARVEAVDVQEGADRLLLRGPQKAGIAIGDSGGGLWRKGRLVGNLWAIVANQQAATENDGSQPRLSNLLFAAMHPLNGPGHGASSHQPSEPIRRMQATRAATLGQTDPAK